jgi:tetratricopeptide (TPR) repeat protein
VDGVELNAYFNQGKVDQAIADYTKAIELDPKIAAAYNNRGIAFKQKGLNSKAVADFQAYLQLNPMRRTAHRSSNGWAN